MKKLLFVLIVALIGILGTCASAAKNDDYTYHIRDGEVIITDSDDYMKGAVVVPETIEGYPVTTITDGTFGGNERIVSITIPDCVTTIEIAFAGCKNLEEVIIPDSVTSLGDYMFQGCAKLKSITIPASIESIGEKPFTDCEKLTNIEVDEDNKHYSSLDGNLYNKDKTELVRYATGKEDKTVTIPEGVTKVGNDAFFMCENIESVYFPKSIEYIGTWAFLECDNLKNVIMPYGNDTVIEMDSFHDNDKLKRVILGNGVKEIRQGSFAFCESIKSVIIPDSVTTLGFMSFFDCAYLDSVHIGKGVTAIGDSAFDQCTRLKNVTMTDSVTKIGDGAFSSVIKLNNVYYSGTKEDWENVEIGILNPTLLEAEMHYEYKPEVKLEAECDVLDEDIGTYVKLGKDKSDVTVLVLFCDARDKIVSTKTYTVTREANEIYLITPDSEEIKKAKVMTIDNVKTENLVNETVTVEISREVIEKKPWEK